MEENHCPVASNPPLPPPAPDDFRALQAEGFTERECEVLGWVVLGKRDAEIAAQLGITRRTVSKHLEHLFAKLQVKSRTAAAFVAQQRLARPISEMSRLGPHRTRVRGIGLGRMGRT